MKLDARQKENFSALERTFETPGWTFLMQKWISERDGLVDRAFWNVKSMEGMMEHRFRYELLEELIRLPATTANAKQVILDTDV